MFDYFGKYPKVSDTHKDVNDKGIWERYCESVGESYDDELQDLLDNFLNNTIVPELLLSKLIPTVERTLGSPVVVLEDDNFAELSESLRRKVIKFVHSIYNIRSTELSYKILLNLLGLTVTSVETFLTDTGFDSDVTLDDETRTLDRSNSGCIEYSINTTGTGDLTTKEKAGIKRILNFLEPINGNLREFTYNGATVALDAIIVYIENGVLYFDNELDQGVTLTFQDGVLYKDGVNAGDYTFDASDGKLYLIT